MGGRKLLEIPSATFILLIHHHPDTSESEYDLRPQTCAPASADYVSHLWGKVPLLPWLSAQRGKVRSDAPKKEALNATRYFLVSITRQVPLFTVPLQ